MINQQQGNGLLVEKSSAAPKSKKKFKLLEKLNAISYIQS